MHYGRRLFRTISHGSCSGYDTAEHGSGAEIRGILDALFCACLDELQADDALLRRDLFRLTEIEGQPLPDVAHTLGLGMTDANAMLAKTRRDMAVLLVLGLCKFSANAPAAKAPLRNCSCRSG